MNLPRNILHCTGVLKYAPTIYFLGDCRQVKHLSAVNETVGKAVDQIWPRCDALIKHPIIAKGAANIMAIGSMLKSRVIIANIGRPIWLFRPG